MKKTSQLPLENTKMDHSHYSYEKWLQNFRLRLLLTLPNFNRKNQGEKQKTMIILLPKISLNPEVISPLYTILTTPSRVIKAHEISGQECTILSFSWFILRIVSSALLLAAPGLSMLDCCAVSSISLSGTVSDSAWELDTSR